MGSCKANTLKTPFYSAQWHFTLRKEWTKKMRMAENGRVNTVKLNIYTSSELMSIWRKHCINELQFTVFSLSFAPIRVFPVSSIGSCCSLVCAHIKLRIFIARHQKIIIQEIRCHFPFVLVDLPLQIDNVFRNWRRKNNRTDVAKQFFNAVEKL